METLLVVKLNLMRIYFNIFIIMFHNIRKSKHLNVRACLCVCVCELDGSLSHS